SGARCGSAQNMNGPALVGMPRWSRQRWMLAIALAAAAQAGLILWLAERPRSSLPPVNFPATIHLAVDAWSAQRLSELPALTDPTVFALPSHHGFSSRAWLRFTPPQYQLTDWSEPNRWLELDAARLGETFSRF